MNTTKVHSAQTVFIHQLNSGTQAQTRLREIRFKAQKLTTIDLGLAVAMPFCAGSVALSVASGGSLAPFIALPHIAQVAMTFANFNRSKHKAKDVQAVNCIDIGFGALGEMQKERRNRLIEHLVGANILVKQHHAGSLRGYALRTTDRIEAILDNSIDFKDLAAGSKDSILSYLKILDRVAPMVRVVRDLETALSKAIEDRNAAQASVISQQLASFQTSIEQEFQSIDAAASEAALDKVEDFILFEPDA